MKKVSVISISRVEKPKIVKIEHAFEPIKVPEKLEDILQERVKVLKSIEHLNDLYSMKIVSKEEYLYSIKKLKKKKEILDIKYLLAIENIILNEKEVTNNIYRKILYIVKILLRERKPARRKHYVSRLKRITKLVFKLYNYSFEKRSLLSKKIEKYKKSLYELDSAVLSGQIKYTEYLSKIQSVLYSLDTALSLYSQNLDIINNVSLSKKIKFLERKISELETSLKVLKLEKNRISFLDLNSDLNSIKQELKHVKKYYKHLKKLRRELEKDLNKLVQKDIIRANLYEKIMRFIT